MTTPDPTDKHHAPLSPLRRSQRQERQDASRPPACPRPTEPLPGQDDPSKPKVVLPPAVQELLDQLPKLPGRSSTPDAQQLLTGNVPAALHRRAAAAASRTTSPPTSSSTSFCRHERTRLDSFDRREPGPGRRRDGPDRHRRRLPRLQRQQGPAVRPHLRAEGRAAQRAEARARATRSGSAASSSASINTIKPVTRTVNGKTQAVAVVDMKLDKDVEPLPVDTTIARPPALGARSQVPGHRRPASRRRRSRPATRSRWGRRRSRRSSTRTSSRPSTSRRATTRATALKGFGDAFAGRGASINQAIAAFNPLFKHLTPVMQTLSDPEHAPGELLQEHQPGVGRGRPGRARSRPRCSERWPRPSTPSRPARSACRTRSRSRRPRWPSARPASTSSARSCSSSRSSRRSCAPTVATLHGKLGTINAALETGTPVLKRTPELNRLTGDVFQALDDLARNPVTLLALKDLHTTFAVLRPLAEFVAPYNTVCNNGNAFFTGLADHMSEDVTGGTSEVVLVEHRHQLPGSRAQPGREPSAPPTCPRTSTRRPTSTRPATTTRSSTARLVRPGRRRPGQRRLPGRPVRLHERPAQRPGRQVPAGQPGQPVRSERLPDLGERARAAPATRPRLMDHPGLAGPTFVGQRLGINNVKDVP